MGIFYVKQDVVENSNEKLSLHYKIKKLQFLIILRNNVSPFFPPLLIGQVPVTKLKGEVPR